MLIPPPRPTAPRSPRSFHGAAMSDPQNALSGMQHHWAFRGEVLPYGEGASDAPMKYETTIAQVCFNLQVCLFR